MINLNSPEIRSKIEGSVVFGKNWGWWRNLNVADTTLTKICGAISIGKKIRIGNAPYANYDRIAQTNSRFSGYSVRTIHAIDNDEA